MAENTNIEKNVADEIKNDIQAIKSDVEALEATSTPEETKKPGIMDKVKSGFGKAKTWTYNNRGKVAGVIGTGLGLVIGGLVGKSMANNACDRDESYDDPGYPEEDVPEEIDETEEIEATETDVTETEE